MRNGTELLDPLIKDIVAEQSLNAKVFTMSDKVVSMEDQSAGVNMGFFRFSLDRFIPLLSERIMALNPFTRTFLVSWVIVLNSIPDIDIIRYLADFLDGLFRFLSDGNVDVRVATATVLGDFLKEIKENAESHNKTADGDVDFMHDNSAGVWVPGQGVSIDYYKVISILMPYVISKGKKVHNIGRR